MLYNSEQLGKSCLWTWDKLLRKTIIDLMVLFSNWYILPNNKLKFETSFLIENNLLILLVMSLKLELEGFKWESCPLKNYILEKTQLQTKLIKLVSGLTRKQTFR